VNQRLRGGTDLWGGIDDTVPMIASGGGLMAVLVTSVGCTDSEKASSLCALCSKVCLNASRT
jgi:hypothetical protein